MAYLYTSETSFSTTNSSTSSIPSTFYDISTISINSDISAHTPTSINSDIAADRTLQEANALKARVAVFNEKMIRVGNWRVESSTFYDSNTSDNISDIAAHRTLQEANALKARVAVFMEKMANWKTERNVGIAPRPVDIIVLPKKAKADDPNVVQSLIAVGNSPFPQITRPVIKCAFVLERWLFCEFTINVESAFSSLSKQIFDKVVMVATNKPTIGRFGYTTMKVARVDKPEDIALVTMLVVDNEEALPAVFGRNAIKYFWPGVLI